MTEHSKTTTERTEKHGDGCDSEVGDGTLRDLCGLCGSILSGGCT